MRHKKNILCQGRLGGSKQMQARIRGTLITSLANRANALVLNTGNKSEGAMLACSRHRAAMM